MSSYKIWDTETAFETTLSSKKHSVLSKSKVYNNPSICLISNNSAETVVWNNAVPEKSKAYINPSIPSNIKSISWDRCLKQLCSREVKSLHQSVNRFQYQLNSAETVIWNNAVPEKSKVHINPSIAFQYQINQPRQLFESTLFPKSQKFTSIRQSLPISNKKNVNPSIASNIK